MPYKDKRKLYAAQKKYRQRKRQQFGQQLEQLKIQFPDAYEIIFGKKKKRRKH